MRRLTAILTAAALFAGAAAMAGAQEGPAWGPGRGGRGMAARMMTDAEGALLSRDALSARLDAAVGAGILTAAEREWMLAVHSLRASGEMPALPPGFERGGRFDGPRGGGTRGGPRGGRGRGCRGCR